MPLALDHINLWLLRDGDGWIIVDSGYDAPMCKEIWDQVFDQFCTPQSVKRVIITHFHPDHIGLASWLAHRCNCKVWMTRGEFEHYRYIVGRNSEADFRQASEFIQQLGFSNQQRDRYIDFFHADDKPAESRVQKPLCKFIANGDRLLINGSEWEIVMGNGHSPEHACLYNAAKNVLISGDQVIPRISSNVSVYLSNRDQDPLGDWLDSCERLKSKIPPDALVLPAHQEPFIGIVPRLQQLIDDHHAQLNRLRLGLVKPLTANEARKILFERDLNQVEVLMATGESLAHINYLLHRNELKKSLKTDGSVTYQTTIKSS